MARETRDQLESSRARYAMQADRERRRADKLYDELRLLENAVREASKVSGSHQSRSELLWELGRRVPAGARPTLAQMRAKRRR